MSDSDKPLHVDEDWKSRVQAEKAKAAGQPAESAAQPAAAPEPAKRETPRREPEPEHEPELPPASMMMLISMLATQAMMSLGHDPRGGQGKPRLAEAKHFIDLLGVIEHKTKGNLDEQEAGSLEEILHQLRMAFVQAKKG